MEVSFLVANSNLMELTSPLIDLSKANRPVHEVANKLLESTTIDDPTSIPSIFSTALTRTFRWSTASSNDNVSAEVAGLTGLSNL